MPARNWQSLRGFGDGDWHRVAYLGSVPIKSDPSDWRDRRQVWGLAGERLAARYLTERGWTVVDHRFRMGRLEVDLVARRGALVAFVEVKTRWSTRFGSPIEAVTWHKQREIVRVARAWVDRHGRPDDTYRFDVIGVTLEPLRPPQVEHLEDAFRADR